MNLGKDRIRYLDGLRGVAILFVIFFHSYTRWSSLYPYRNMFEKVDVFSFGWVGVQLFFLISGFVISLTLEKSKSMPAFLFQRWLRLFPAIFVCSILVFLTAPLFPERPAGQPHLIDLLPGISLISTDLWSDLFHVNAGVLEGSFWSLFVEVKFYFIFGGLYFLFGSSAAISVMLALFIIAAIMPLVPLSPSLLGSNFMRMEGNLMEYLSARHFGWFVAGALFYRYQTGDKRLLISALLVSVISALAVRELWLGAALAAFAMALLFYVSLISKTVQKILCQRWLLFFGFISYPLYLIHENMMVAMIVKLGALLPVIPAVLVPVIPLMVVSVISWILATWVEVPLRNLLASVFTRCEHATRIFRSA